MIEEFAYFYNFYANLDDDPNCCPDCGEPRGCCQCDQRESCNENDFFDYPFRDISFLNEDEE